MASKNASQNQQSDKESVRVCDYKNEKKKKRKTIWKFPFVFLIQISKCENEVVHSEYLCR